MQTDDALLIGDIVRVRSAKGRWRFLGPETNNRHAMVRLEPADAATKLVLANLVAGRSTRGNISISGGFWEITRKNCCLHVTQCFRDGKAMKKQREADKRVKPT